MSSAVGIPKNFVDTQDVSLENLSDSKIYTQLTDVSFTLDSTVEKNQLTNDRIDNVFSLRMISIEGNMVITNPEWADLVALTFDVGGIRPVNTWQVNWTDADGTTVTTAFNGQVQTLTPIDVGLGVVTLFFRIQSDEVGGVV